MRGDVSLLFLLVLVPRRPSGCDHVWCLSASQLSSQLSVLKLEGKLGMLVSLGDGKFKNGAANLNVELDFQKQFFYISFAWCLESLPPS